MLNKHLQRHALESSLRLASGLLSLTFCFEWSLLLHKINNIFFSGQGGPDLPIHRFHCCRVYWNRFHKFW